MSRPHSISPQSAGLQLTGYAPTVWISANFSEAWYRDTLREAQGQDADHSKRREIVFAASFLESYIFEWVRSICIDRTTAYFPTKKFKPLKDKWKEIPEALHRDRLIPKLPRLTLAPLGKLVEYRNGLVHARASRPSRTGLPPDSQPLPEIDGLSKLIHGWALQVAKDLVLELHTELGTLPPKYL